MKKVEEVEILDDASNATDEDKVDQVTASFAAEGSTMSRLKEWNDLYGEGGSKEERGEAQLFFL
ncbi:hypothetical protein MtrunA17_Chr1g0204061 [Medicago truncatula]|uniref:Uncharacterized protein n=1 Tax=Medicago truncatula TaxID=3880 RepID=A0A396JUB7_MEDTR|nr:hypothetical protein MtrunA17_Chr1g0204061 [Medicago truncatula]